MVIESKHAHALVALLILAVTLGAVFALGPQSTEVVQDMETAARQLGAPQPGRAVGEISDPEGSSNQDAAGPPPGALARVVEEAQPAIPEVVDSGSDPSTSETLTSQSSSSTTPASRTARAQATTNTIIATTSSTPTRSTVTPTTAPGSTTSAVPRSTTSAVPRSTTSAAPASRAERTTESVIATAPDTTAAPQTTTTRAPRTTTTQRPEQRQVLGATVSVSTDGRATGAGFSGIPINEALRQAEPGTTFLFAPGRHRPITLRNVDGTSGRPIVLEAADTGNPPIFSDGSYSASAGVLIENSSHVELRNLSTRTTLWGFRVAASNNVDIVRASVDDVGQEGIRITQRSSHISITGSTIRNTGQRAGTHSSGDPFSLFGEGIYLGTGNDTSDEVHHVEIRNNRISRTTSEAIDIKQPVHNVTVTNNTISDIRTATSGAVVVHVQKNWSARNPNITISNNTISRISTSSPYRDGVGILIGSSATVTGNTIADTQHYAIRIDDAGAQGSNIRAEIRNNTLSRSGSDPIWRSGTKANVIATDNRIN